MVKATIEVSTSAELREALRTATGGERIELGANAEGYSLDVNNFRAATSEVVITSADPGNKANFTWVNLQGANNWTFENLTFIADPDDVAARNWANADINIYNSQNIVVRDSVMTGYGEGIGGIGTNGNSLMRVRNSSDVTIEDNAISHYFHGIALQEVSDVAIRGNDISQIQGDGIRMVQIEDVTIDGNYIHDFLGSANDLNHDDMIQLWSTGATDVSRGLSIINNVLDAGDGAGTQSIFLGNEQTRGNDPDVAWNYQDFVIQNNTVMNGHLHGITVGGIDGLLVAMNTLIRTETPMMTASGYGTGPVYTPTIRTNDHSPQVMVLGNNAGISVEHDDAIEFGNGSTGIGANTQIMGALDAGWTRSTVEDTDDAHIWASRDLVRDETGALVQRDVAFDNGTRRLKTFDTEDDAPFVFVDTKFNADNMIDSHVIVYDDGSRTKLKFDPDDDNSQTYSETHWDAAGDLALRRIVFDDGRVRDIIYEDGVRTEVLTVDTWDVRDWYAISIIFDADGSVASRSVIPDDALLV